MHVIDIDKKKRGPKIEPWGTPQVISRSGEPTPSRITDCLREDRYDENQLLAGPLMP